MLCMKEQLLAFRLAARDFKFFRRYSGANQGEDSFLSFEDAAESSFFNLRGHRDCLRQYLFVH